MHPPPTGNPQSRAACEGRARCMPSFNSAISVRALAAKRYTESLPCRQTRTTLPAMTDSATEAVAAAFHTMRATRKRKPIPGGDKLREAVEKRVKDMADEAKIRQR